MRYATQQQKIVIYFIRPEARNETSSFRAKRSLIEAKPVGRRSTVSNQWTKILKSAENFFFLKPEKCLI